MRRPYFSFVRKKSKQKKANMRHFNMAFRIIPSSMKFGEINFVRKKSKQKKAKLRHDNMVSRIIPSSMKFISKKKGVGRYVPAPFGCDF